MSEQDFKPHKTISFVKTPSLQSRQIFPLRFAESLLAVLFVVCAQSASFPLSEAIELTPFRIFSSDDDRYRANSIQSCSCSNSASNEVAVSVTVLTNDFLYDRGAPDRSTIARVEFLAGPNRTLFDLGPIAGSVSYITKCAMTNNLKSAVGCPASQAFALGLSLPILLSRNRSRMFRATTKPPLMRVFA